MNQLKITPLIVMVALLAFSCQDQFQETQVETEPLESASSNIIPQTTHHGKYALYKAEYYTSGIGNKVGNVVYFNHRGKKHLETDFVPFINEDGTSDISYYVDNNRPSEELNTTISESAIGRAMNTWDKLACSNLGMTKVPFDGRSAGFITALYGYGGNYDYVADIYFGGWLPWEFFDQLTPDGGFNILAITFTLIYLDESGAATDLDNNGKFDTAWTEIYFNDAFTWNDGNIYDVETVALHEAGHGLGQGHFGKAFTTLKNGKFHFAPQAVMNSAYTDVQTKISGTDLAGHCSNWANWPSYKK
jgi:hypothetical protein